MIEPFADIKTISESIRRQEILPLDVENECLKRIEELNPNLNAFITVLGDQALEQAKEAGTKIKAGNWLGPLHGIPVGIKDFYDTAGIKTTAAYKHFKDRVPGKDAIAVAKLKNAGAIIMGKMNMHQLGMGTTGLDSYFGPVYNPWNSEYIPGGSSAGSAAAVASGMCFATLDTDAIGSCRLPAACCGVVGFKGTYGLISSKGILEGEQADDMILWLSHPGIITRSVEDTALVLDVLAEKSEQIEKLTFFGGLAKSKNYYRIGAANNFKADQEVTLAFEKAVETIRSLGNPVVSTTVPFWDYSRGIENIETDRKSIAGQAFKEIDILLLPTTSTVVPMVKEAAAHPQVLSPENTVFANYYGLPAISIPCGFDTNGLPLGLQIVGKPWDEGAVLQLAHQYEKTTLWNTKHPTF